MEQVLCVSADRFRQGGEFHGFRPFDEAYFRHLLDARYLSFQPRDQVETDPSFKQLIPYVVIRCGSDLFHYARGSAGSERRLASRRSVGIGGHINHIDGPAAEGPYWAGMRRELAEEVLIDGPRRESMLGFIYDDSTPVGEVHLGVVHLIDLEEPLVWPREAAIDAAGFAPLRDLVRQRDQFETWSQLVMEQLIR